MSIPCPACGREYDVTLFQFGRTIHCTCGSRVALEKRIPMLRGRGSPRFVVDSMLGRLARWLRVLGYDTLYDPEATDAALVRSAVTDGRYLLTRDRRLPEEWRFEGIVLVEAEEPLEQLRGVVLRFGLRPGKTLFSRCTVCNAPLEPVGKEEVRGRVPDRVFERVDRFARCPSCRRLYWEGTHTARMRARLSRILGG